MAGERRIVLVDASIYVFRAWFTLPESITDARGRPANAVHGFGDFLIGLLRTARPTHIACAFDQSLTTSFRNRLWPSYKANREPAPADLKHQFRECERLATALGVRTLASRRYEADDLIASAAARMRARGYRATVVTADKDLAQVLRPGDHWWHYAADQRLGYHDVRRRWGVRPEQMADWLALTGDPVDNIPGVPGIGPKTAAALLDRYRDLDKLLAGRERLASSGMRGAPRLAALLHEHAQTARLARSLTVVAVDAPVPGTAAEYRWAGGDRRRLQALFRRQGFGAARQARYLEAVSAPS